jgi:serine/threonine-protein kinase
MSEEPRVVDRRYTIRREIGRGGACVVYEAVHKVTHRVVALKQLLDDRRSDPVMRARLLREGEAIAAVANPNIVQVLDAGQEPDGAPYLILEYLEGRTLEGLIAARGALAPRDALSVVREICTAMAAVHDAGFIHRDLKPSNVLVMAGNNYESLEGARIKLLDFGIVAAPRFEDASKLTGDNVLVGTLAYMPPERIMGPDAGAVAWDIYGLGATLFECLTGRAPFEGDSLEIVSRLVTYSVPSARSIRPDLPSQLDPILEKALHRDGKQRYQDAREFARALAAALESIGTTQPSTDGASRRRHVRAPYITPVRLESGTLITDGRTEDLSANGLMVLLAATPPSNARVAIRFALPTTGAYVKAEAIVRWTRPLQGRARLACAVGLEFIDLDPEVRGAIETFVRIVGTEVNAASGPRKHNGHRKTL